MARGPGKVRVFQNLRKSASWYVEWRDTAGQRHCESCGASEADARERAVQIERELRVVRSAAKGPLAKVSQHANTPNAEEGRDVVTLRAMMRCAALQVPVELVVELTPELRRSLASMASM